MKEITKSRLKLIIAKAQLLLATDDSRHSAESEDAIYQISIEVEKARVEISNGRGCPGDR